MQKYNRNKSNYIIIKYILTEENYNNKEIDAFINLLIRFNLVNCNFEISTDYKFENLNIEKAFSIVYFYNTLRKAGAEFIYFDDHVRKRLYRTLKNNIDKIDLEKNNLFENLREFFDQDIIVWGTGAYANEIIKNSFLFKKSKVAFFVDSKISKSDDLFLNCHVLKPEKLLGTNKPIFIASSTYWQTIYKKILKLGVNKNRVINTLVI